jgi:hypothetical protein
MKKNNVQVSQHKIKRYLKNLKRLSGKTVLSTHEMRLNRMRENIFTNLDLSKSVDKEQN